MIDSEKLRGMEDHEVSILCDNARRLSASGSAGQKVAATALLPAVEAELAERNTVKLAKRAEAVAARKASKVKPPDLAD